MTTVNKLTFVAIVLTICFGLAGLLDQQQAVKYIQTLRPAAVALLFWGPICGIITYLFTKAFLRLMGIVDLSALRKEIVEQNNAAAAILVVGAPLIVLVFLQWVVRP